MVKLAISDILYSILFILALYTSFFTHLSCFYILSLLQSTGTGTNLKTSDLSTLIFKCLNWYIFQLSISNSSTLDFKSAKLTFLTNFEVSKTVAFF